MAYTPLCACIITIDGIALVSTSLGQLLKKADPGQILAVEISHLCKIMRHRTVCNENVICLEGLAPDHGIRLAVRPAGPQKQSDERLVPQS